MELLKKQIEEIILNCHNLSHDLYTCSDESAKRIAEFIEANYIPKPKIEADKIIQSKF